MRNFNNSPNLAILNNENMLVLPKTALRQRSLHLYSHVVQHITNMCSRYHVLHTRDQTLSRISAQNILARFERPVIPACKDPLAVSPRKRPAHQHY